MCASLATFCTDASASGLNVNSLHSSCADQIRHSAGVSQLLGVLSLPHSNPEDEMQRAAASSLLDLVACGQAGLDADMHCHLLVQGVQMGSLEKRACLAAVLGLLNISEQSRSACCAASQSWSRHPAFLQAVPVIVKLLIEAESAPWVCQAMILSSLEALVHNLAGLQLFIQVGGIEALSNIVSKAGDVTAWGQGLDLADNSSDTDGSGEDSSDEFIFEDSSGELHQVWLLVLNLLYKAVKYTSAGMRHLLAVPLLPALIRCTSSHAEELQLAALHLLSLLASRPVTWPAFSKAGQAWHLAVAAHSPCPEIQAKAVRCIHAMAATFSQQDEEIMLRLAQSLSNSAHSCAVPA